MRVVARLIRQVAAPTVADPDRILEDFDTGIDEAEANEDSTSFTSSTGADTLTHSAVASVTGGNSLRINGTDQHYLTAVLDADSARFRRHYVWLEGVSTETTWISYTYAADGTTVAFRYGITSDRKITLQTGTTGTGTGLVAGSTSLSLLSWINFEVTVTGGNNVRLVAYTDANVNSSTETDAHTIVTVPITAAATVGNVAVGNMTALTAGTGTIITPNLLQASYTFTTDNVAITSTLVSPATSVGSGSLTTDVGTFLASDTSGIRINGPTSHYIRNTFASHTVRYDRVRIKYNGAPSAATAYLMTQRDGPNAAVVCQLGIGTDGKLKGRLGSSGTAVSTASALTVGNEYDVVIETHASGVFKVGYVLGSSVDANPAVALTENVTMVATLTSTTLGNINVGQIANVTGTSEDITILRWWSSTDGVPSPPNATGGAAPDILIDHWVERTDAMPEIVEVDFDSSTVVNEFNVPANGCWWGASTTKPGTVNGGTSAEGLAVWEEFAERSPDVLHFFEANKAWDGNLPTAHKNLLVRANKPRAMPFYNWKVRGTGADKFTCAEVRDGANDENIERWARNIEKYPYKVFIALNHEPETNNELSTTGNSANEYADMQRHVITHAKEHGASNVIWAWITTGSSSNAGTNGSTWNALWPGDDVIDWLCWDPYWSTTAKTDFYGAFFDSGRSLLAENGSGATGWTAIGGMYGWATTAKTVGGSGNSTGLRYTFGGNKPLGITEFGVWFDIHTDAQGASRFESIGTQIFDAPRIKMLMYYNNTQDHDNHIDGRPLSEAAYAAVGALPYFNVGTANAK